MVENAIQFYKELITRHIESVKDSLSDTKYRIYIAIIDSCTDLEKLKDMADFDMQNDFLTYSKEISNKLGEYDTTIEELESIYNGEYETIDLDEITKNERKEAEENRIAEISSTVDKMMNNFDNYENIVEKLMQMQTERDEEEYGVEYRIDIDYDDNEEILEEELPEIENSGLTFENDEEDTEEEYIENTEEDSDLDDDEELDSEEFTQEELAEYFDTNNTDGTIYYNDEELDDDYEEPEDTITFDDIDRELEIENEEIENEHSDEIEYAEEDDTDNEDEYDDSNENGIEFDSEDDIYDSEDELYGDSNYIIEYDDFDDDSSDYEGNYDNIESISDTLEQFEIADDDFDDNFDDTLEEENDDGGIEFEEEDEDEPDFNEILKDKHEKATRESIKEDKRVTTNNNGFRHTTVANNNIRKQPNDKPKRQFNTQTEHGKEAQRMLSSIGKVLSRAEKRTEQVKKDTTNYFNNNNGDRFIDF